MTELRTSHRPADGAGCATGRADLRWSASWCVEAVDGATCVLSAGADRRVAVDGLSSRQLSAVTSWARGAPIDRADDLAHLIDRLAEVGAVELGPSGATVALVGDSGPAGDATADLARHLADHRVAVASSSERADLAVLVRTGASWPMAPAGIHLAVDLALDHTVVLGPLVVPGVSTCVRCVAGRAAHRWGGVAVPARPHMTTRPAVVAALLAVQIELAVARRSPLVNATIAWDLERGVADRQHVYKLPGCPVCDRGVGVGRVGLPWSIEAGRR